MGLGLYTLEILRMVHTLLGLYMLGILRMVHTFEVLVP
jgi:hypothetical protein